MRTNDLIVFIDSKGVAHNALVKSFREHRDEKDKLVHPTPLVTLTYHTEPTGEPKEVIDVQHISHPGRQETNPDLPTYALHAWAHEGEDYLEVPPDHPLHDHPYALPEKDQDGNIVPKRRPIYEKHIEWHKSGRVSGTLETAHGEAAVAPILGGRVQADAKWETCPTDGSFLQKDQPDGVPYCPTCRTKQASIPVGHPAHPDTVAFDFKCESCGKDVTRIASHQGGKQWDKPPGSEFSQINVDGGSLPSWREHFCTQADIDAYRESLKPKPPAAPEPSPSERLAGGEQLAKVP